MSRISNHIYRYIGFDAFQNLLSTKQLLFKSPLSWPDKYEGVLYSLADNAVVRDKIWKVAQYYTNDKNEVPQDIKDYAPFVRRQCWTYYRDKVVMWNAYPYNREAIMIGTEKTEMAMLPVRIRNIIYVPNDFKVEEIIPDIVDKTGISIQSVFVHKREEFEYEHEVRYFLKSDLLKKSEIKDIMTVDIPDIRCFIKEVLVHPEADDEYVGKIRAECMKYGVAFNGKSQLYDYTNAI